VGLLVGLFVGSPGWLGADVVALRISSTLHGSSARIGLLVFVGLAVGAVARCCCGRPLERSYESTRGGGFRGRVRVFAKQEVLMHALPNGRRRGGEGRRTQRKTSHASIPSTSAALPSWNVGAGAAAATKLVRSGREEGLPKRQLRLAIWFNAA